MEMSDTLTIELILLDNNLYNQEQDHVIPNMVLPTIMTYTPGDTISCSHRVTEISPEFMYAISSMSCFMILAVIRMSTDSSLNLGQWDLWCCA